MSSSVNKVILVGNLGQDPEVRTTPSGQMVSTFSLATSETFNNRENERQERTEWHRIVAWGKLAELTQRFLAKGSKVYIEGKIQSRSWDDAQTGQKRYSTEIVASTVLFLDGKGRSEQAPPPVNREAPVPQSKPSRGAPATSDEPFDFSNDVPF